MSADWNTPTSTSLYTAVLSTLKDRDLDAATQFNNGTATNIPTGAVKWDTSLNRWQKYASGAWGELTATYQLTGVTCTSLSNTGNTTLGDSAADAVTVNAGSWTFNNATSFGGSGALSFSNNLTLSGATTHTGGLIASSTVEFGGTVTTGYGVSTGSVVLEHGGDRTGDGIAAFDLHATSGTDFEARLIRNGGANGTLQMINTGTGEMQIRQNGAGDVVIITNSVERLRITSGGSIEPAGSIKSRVSTGSALSGAWNSDSYDLIAATAQNAGVTIAADSGTPTNGRKAVFRVLDDGTARTITFTGGVSKGFRPVGATLTASGSNWTYDTTAGKETYFGCIFNARADRWDIIAISKEA